MMLTLIQHCSTKSFSSFTEENDDKASKMALKVQPTGQPAKARGVKKLSKPPMVMKAKADAPGNVITRFFAALNKSQGKTSKPALPVAKGVYAVQLNAMEAESLQTISTQNSSTTSNSKTSSNATNDSIEAVWVASTAEDHNKGVPAVIRRPQHDAFNEPDDTKLLKKIMVRARTLPQNTGKFASNHIMINTERTRRNVPPLTRERELDRLAREHAKFMAESKMVRHMDSPAELQARIVEGKDDADRQRLFFPRLGVNISRGRSVEEIHKFMMATLAERNNIIDKRFTTMGMGTHRANNGVIYLCQIFGGQ